MAKWQEGGFWLLMVIIIITSIKASIHLFHFYLFATNKASKKPRQKPKKGKPRLFCLIY